MPIPLIALVVNALWGFGLAAVLMAAKMRAAGAAPNASARGQKPASPAWLEPLGRELSNHLESFPLFLTAVIAVHIVGKHSHVSGVASVVYAVSRVLHAVFHLAGLKRPTMGTWTVGSIALFVILSRLLT
jgi:uncharacterized MAPEG superfamily protein